MGETSVLADTDGGNGGLLLAQAAVLTQDGTLTSLSFYARTAAGQLRLGVYNAAGQIVVQTAAFTPVVGWNTQAVGQVPVVAGNYWLAYTPSSSNLTFPVDQGNGSCRWVSRTFQAMPPTFPAVSGSNPCHWSFYATLSVP